MHLIKRILLPTLFILLPLEFAYADVFDPPPKYSSQVKFPDAFDGQKGGNQNQAYVFQNFDNRYGHHRSRFGDYGWELYRGHIPMNAVIGGYEPSRTIYICQAHYQGGVHPGKVVSGKCHISYGGREHEQNYFRVLIGQGVGWRRGQDGSIPTGAVPGGYEKNHPLYICRAEYKGGRHPGKLVGPTCNIGYGGKELQLNPYEVLVSD